jgi:hypothetical protein
MHSSALLAAFVLIPPYLHGQEVGAIGGRILDPSGGGIVGAEIAIAGKWDSVTRVTRSGPDGGFLLPDLPPGEYSIRIRASGFDTAAVQSARVVPNGTTRVDVTLSVGLLAESITVLAPVMPLQLGSAAGSAILNSAQVNSLPLPTQNFTQAFALAPGVSVPLGDYTAVGRSSQDAAVNGARVTQNAYELDGIDLANWSTNTAVRIALPAVESIGELEVETAGYDAASSRIGGGTIRVVTKRGGGEFHGAGHGYFQNDALNANNPFLKAAGVERPRLRRNIFGGMLGGPIRRDKAFFFNSYQGIRESNAATANSLSSSVLIAPCVNGRCLTDDRSAQTLLATFRPLLPSGLPALSIDPVALALLNTRLPDGRFLIPTPQVEGRYSGTASSTYREDQFGGNLDLRLDDDSTLPVRAFVSNGDAYLAMFAGPTVPGYGANQEYRDRVFSVRHHMAVTPRATNEALFGYSYVRSDSVSEQPIDDHDFGIHRSTSAETPGLPLISIAASAGGVAFGTAAGVIDFLSTASIISFADTLSLRHGSHQLRIGGEFRYYRNELATKLNHRGAIDFSSFNDFLTGSTASAVLGNGIGERDLRAGDYSFFVQDDWALRPTLNLSFGARYDLMLPPSDTDGRLATFDPALYQPRLGVSEGGVPIGPPIAGFVQAGNVIPRYDLPEVPNVSDSLLHSSDLNNIAPRVGAAYSPLPSLVVRAGYGVFYSRVSTFYLGNTIRTPPNYAIVRTTFRPLSDPFFPLPSRAQFPSFVPGPALAGQAIDRNLRTPYLHKYSAAVQFGVSQDQTLEIAYSGTRSLGLFRTVNVNQAPLASVLHPIVNAVTGQVITTNTPSNATLRAPYQGVGTSSFAIYQSTAQATYHSLQLRAAGRLGRNLQAGATYTFGKSLDNSSSASVVNGEAANENAPNRGNQPDNRAHRGLSDFDQKHRLVGSFHWEFPANRSGAGTDLVNRLLSGWQIAGVLVATSGLPIDVVDSVAGSFYGLSGNVGALARPNAAPGVRADRNIPPGYYFNPFAFVRPVVPSGQPIPSSGGEATSGALGTDIGGLGRNTLRGPRRTNFDLFIARSFPIRESVEMELRAEFFNLLNHVNLANPVSNLSAVQSSGGDVNPNTGEIRNNAGDFGRIRATVNNPRLVQIALKLSF